MKSTRPSLGSQLGLWKGMMESVLGTSVCSNVLLAAVSVLNIERVRGGVSQMHHCKKPIPYE